MLGGCEGLTGSTTSPEGQLTGSPVRARMGQVLSPWSAKPLPSAPRTCQILCMMLRKFNFPTVALHSMMKQVSGTTPFLISASLLRFFPISDLEHAPSAYSMLRGNQSSSAVTERAFCRPGQVQIQHLPDPDRHRCGLPVSTLGWPTVGRSCLSFLVWTVALMGLCLQGPGHPRSAGGH